MRIDNRQKKKTYAAAWKIRRYESTHPSTIHASTRQESWLGVGEDIRPECNQSLLASVAQILMDAKNLFQ